MVGIHQEVYPIAFALRLLCLHHRQNQKALDRTIEQLIFSILSIQTGYAFFQNPKKILSNTFLYNNFPRSFCSCSHLISNNKKRNETFFVLLVMVVWFEIYKIFYQHEFFYKLFLPTKFRYTKIFFLVFKFGVKNNL